MQNTRAPLYSEAPRNECHMRFYNTSMDTTHTKIDRKALVPELFTLTCKRQRINLAFSAIQTKK